MKEANNLLETYWQLLKISWKMKKRMYLYEHGFGLAREEDEVE